MDSFAARHRMMADGIVVEDGKRHHYKVNLAESPLAMLARRKGRSGSAYLDGAEVGAGERLRADFSHGQIMPRIGQNWQFCGAKTGNRGAGSAVDLSNSALAARQRVDRAMEAVGPELAGILIDVCCFLKGLEQVEIERGWPKRSAKLILKTALSALHRHYSPKVNRRRSILNWGAEGYRPTITR